MTNTRNWKFSPESALVYASSIAKPRRAGSDGEKNVADQLQCLLEKFGYCVDRHPFHFIMGGARILPIYIAIKCLWILFYILTLISYSWFHLLLFGAFFFLDWRFPRIINHIQSHMLLPPGDYEGRVKPWWEPLLGREIGSSNIIASQADFTEGKKTHIYLVANYDSKSLRIPISFQLWSYKLYLYGFRAGWFVLKLLIIVAFFGLITVGFGFVPLTLWLKICQSISLLFTVIGLATIFMGLPSLCQGVGNKSSGAFMNASGVGLLLHLAEILADHRDLRDKFKITILFTSAGEERHFGVEAFVRDYHNALSQEAKVGNVFIINVEGIGMRETLLLEPHSNNIQDVRDRVLTRIIEETCSEEDIPLGRFPNIITGMSHTPFLARGFNAVSIGMMGESLRVLYSPQDTVDKLTPQGFEQAGEMILSVIEQLASIDEPAPVNEEFAITRYMT